MNCSYDVIKYVLSVLFTVFTFSSYAQSVNTYLADLDELYTILQKTSSFKEQITGQRQQDYQARYEQLKVDTLKLKTDYDAFYQLAQLFFPLRDNHLGFYQLPGSVLKSTQFTDSVAVNQYKATKFFQEYPKIDMDLDSLESVLNRKANDSIEGIYQYDSYLKIGLFRSRIKNQLTGVVLSTAMPVWEKGQVAIRLYEFYPNYFRAIYGHPLHKGLILYNNEKFRHQSLINSSFYGTTPEAVYRKKSATTSFAGIAKNKPVFEYKRLKKEIDYIRLGSFSARPLDIPIAQQFYERIKDSLTAPHLLVDLRDNTGGAAKVARPYVNLIRRYAQKGKVYVLINNGTMSQGEMVTLQLKKVAGLKTYGEPTKGTITYGSNYGNPVRLSSGKYVVYPTDMKDEGPYLPYENVGVAPDILLRNDRDWLAQIIAEIDKNL